MNFAKFLKMAFLQSKSMRLLLAEPHIQGKIQGHYFLFLGGCPNRCNGDLMKYTAKKKSAEYFVGLSEYSQ